MFRTIETPSKQHGTLFCMGYNFKCSEYVKTRKNLEALYIILWKPNFKNQIDLKQSMIILTP